MKRTTTTTWLIALVAILVASSSLSAQPVTRGGGLARVAHDNSLAGSGTSTSPLTLDIPVQDCAAGSFFDSNTALGAFLCVAEVGDISTVTTTANMGLTGGGTSGAVSVGLLTTCADGQVLVSGASGTTWTCASNLAGEYITAVSSDFTVTTGTLDLSTAVTAPGTLAVVGNTTIDGVMAVRSAAGVSTIHSCDSTCTNIWKLGRDNAVSGDFHIGTQATAGIVTFSSGAAAAALTLNSSSVLAASGGFTTPATLTTTGTGDLVSGDALTVAGMSTIAGLTGTVLAPTAITGTNNDYAPTGFATATTVNLTTSAAAIITGLAGGADGRRVRLCSSGTHTITLREESALSTAANRFAGIGPQPLLGGLPSCHELEYRTSNSRWNFVTPYQFAGVYTGAYGVTMINNGDFYSLAGDQTPTTPTTCGTSPTHIGTDTAGIVTIGTGGSATSCTVPYIRTYTDARACTVTSQMAARGDLYISASSGTSFTVSNVAGAAWPASGKFNYICVGIASSTAPAFSQ